MAHVTITVDGAVWLDGDLGNWQHKPPAHIQARLRSPTQREPWFMAIMAALTDAAVTDQQASIDVQTRAGGWTLRVDSGGVVDVEVLED